MDITNILNSKGSAAAVTGGHQFPPSLVRMVQGNDRQLSETSSELESSPEQSSGYSTRPTRPLQAMPRVLTGVRYPSPSQIEQPMPLLASGYAAPNISLGHEYAQESYQDEQSGLPSRSSGGGDSVRAFACTTCGKGFARRSDLARHGKPHSVRPPVSLIIDGAITERIHTGVRPHVCDFPGCNKQFIQRSALTVHARVHTGEKPHMCERCGKVCHYPGAG